MLRSLTKTRFLSSSSESELYQCLSLVGFNVIPLPGWPSGPRSVTQDDKLMACAHMNFSTQLSNKELRAFCHSQPSPQPLRAGLIKGQAGKMERGGANAIFSTRGPRSGEANLGGLRSRWAKFTAGTQPGACENTASVPHLTLRHRPEGTPHLRSETQSPPFPLEGDLERNRNTSGTQA